MNIALSLKPVSYTHLDVYKRQGLGVEEMMIPVILAARESEDPDALV